MKANLESWIKCTYNYLRKIIKIYRLCVEARAKIIAANKQRLNEINQAVEEFDKL